MTAIDLGKWLEHVLGYVVMWERLSVTLGDTGDCLTVRSDSPGVEYNVTLFTETILEPGTSLARPSGFGTGVVV